MSDVLVNGMEMPVGCLSCPFYCGDGCKAMWKLFKDWQNVAVRPSECPLVEIKTPHGRLIDADDLLRDNQELADCDFIHPKYDSTLRELIEDAPTIVPAEGGDGRCLPCRLRDNGSI